METSQNTQWQTANMTGLVERLERIKNLFEEISVLSLEMDKEKIENLIKLEERKNENR